MQIRNDAPPSPSSSFSSSTGPSTPPASSPHDSLVGPIRSEKLLLVRSNLLARRGQRESQRTVVASKSVLPARRTPSSTPVADEEEEKEFEPTAEARLSPRVGLLRSLGAIGLSSSMQMKESFVRGGSSDEEEVRVKVERTES